MESEELERGDMERKEEEIWWIWIWRYSEWRVKICTEKSLRIKIQEWSYGENKEEIWSIYIDIENWSRKIRNMGNWKYRELRVEIRRENSLRMPVGE